ncbi:ubiquinone-dependent pyruvate dehydrogenase [Labilithrix luteola]|nr:ubiquinone-dependent pyruvate dehydrogenase [Labilithrix luteola]
MGSVTAATFLLETLKRSGIRRIYGIAGDSLNALTEAIRRERDFEWVHVRHEEVAAFAAGAEAHLTKRLTVCAGSCGPGNLHLINGLYDCHRSRVPVLAIAAQIPTAEIGTNYFQETHPERIFEGCSDYCAVVADPAQLPRMLKIAMETAVSRRGVSVLVVPGDVAWQKLKEPAFALPIAPAPSYVRPSEQQLERVVRLLDSARRVTILAGAGCSGGHTELVALARKLKAPIVHAMRGKEFVEYDNPFDVGMTGLLGFASGYYAMTSCDLLLVLGSDFPYAQFYPDVATVQVDVRQENIGRRTRVDLGVVGGVRETAELLLERLVEKTSTEHLERALRHYARTRRELDELATPGSIRGSVHPQYVARLVNELAGDDAIFTCDVGTPSIWAARYLRMNGKRRLLGSFNHGSMANALPQAIGAQVAFPGRQVVSLSGDGGFTMLMGDFLTLRQRSLPIKTIVFDNGALGFVELEMKAAGLRETATELDNPNFATMAEAVGIRGIRVTEPRDLMPALEAAFRFDGPVLVDVVVNRLELSIPPRIEFQQAKGFGLFALRTVIDGKGAELVELAHSNLWR